MRTPVEVAVQKIVPIEAKPATTAPDAATVSRPFAYILAEAESVQDVVRLTVRTPAAAVVWQDAWTGLCRGVDHLFGPGIPLSPVTRSRMRRLAR
jgi:hypothetical protein